MIYLPHGNSKNYKKRISISKKSSIEGKKRFFKDNLRINFHIIKKKNDGRRS